MKNTVCAYVYTMNSVYVLPLAENYHLRTVMYGVWHTYTVWTRFGPTLHLALCAWSRPPKRQSWPSWLIKRALHTLLFYSARLAHPLACLLQKPVLWCQLQILYIHIRMPSYKSYIYTRIPSYKSYIYKDAHQSVKLPAFLTHSFKHENTNAYILYHNV
jgi:hypothetical protein